MKNKLLYCMMLSAVIAMPMEANALICQTPRSCDGSGGLGYNMTPVQCEGKTYLKCPFDTSKVWCGEVSSGGNTRPNEGDGGGGGGGGGGSCNYSVQCLAWSDTNESWIADDGRCYEAGFVPEGVTILGVVDQIDDDNNTAHYLKTKYLVRFDSDTLDFEGVDDYAFNDEGTITKSNVIEPIAGCKVKCHQGDILYGNNLKDSYCYYNGEPPAGKYAKAVVVWENWRYAMLPNPVYGPWTSPYFKLDEYSNPARVRVCDYDNNNAPIMPGGTAIDAHEWQNIQAIRDASHVTGIDSTVLSLCNDNAQNSGIDTFLPTGDLLDYAKELLWNDNGVLKAKYVNAFGDNNAFIKSDEVTWTTEACYDNQGTEGIVPFALQKSYGGRIAKPTVWIGDPVVGDGPNTSLPAYCFYRFPIGR